MELHVIATMRSDFKTKFGIPRQGGLSKSLKSYVVFQKEYSVPEAFRGIEEYSHIILIWGFSEARYDKFMPTVRPPRLGGNKRVGVFATRSPFRPNSLGISCVKLGRKFIEDGNMILEVFGADLMNGTPIYDVKPYLPYVDSIPDATGGFSEIVKDNNLKVLIPDDLLVNIPTDKVDALYDILSQDPRPHYIEDSERIYGFEFSNMEIKFKVEGKTLTVTDVIIN